MPLRCTFTSIFRQKFVAGIYLLLAFDTIIPANTESKFLLADFEYPYCLFKWENRGISKFLSKDLVYQKWKET